jgi:RHS repeat-associated protein
VRYFHYDANGNCTLQTDLFGNIVEQYDYDAFGWPYFYDAWGNNIGYSPWGNRMLFTGREWLGELHLYDYRNRLYQPELGRFMQPDPKEFAAGDYNLYRYCHNDPVNRADPLGLTTVEFGYYRPVTGSWIPQFTTLFTVIFNPNIGGNFNNPTPQNNSKSGLTAYGKPAHGKTEPTTSVSDLGSHKLEANLSINVWINPAAAAKFGFDRIAGLEKEHVYGGEGYKMKGLIGPGGFWDQEKAKIGGSISVWRWQNGADALSSQLSHDLHVFDRAQHAEMDAQYGSHDLPPF